MLADQIRQFVYTNYIVPARQRHQLTVTIRAGDVHADMNLSSRMPAVCGAIGTRIFEQQYRVHLIKRQGPSQGANVYFTFSV